MTRNKWSASRADGRWPWVSSLRMRGPQPIAAIALTAALVAVATVGMLGDLVVHNRSAGLGVALDTVVPAPKIRSAVEVTPRSRAQRQWLLARSADVWSEDQEDPTLVLVFDGQALEALRQANIPYSTVVRDIDAVAQRERARIESAATQGTKDWFAEYKDVDAVDAYVDELAWSFPKLAEIQPLGTSLEGRPIRALKIGTGIGGRADVGGIAINGGQHAREWISVMVTTCIADRLLRGYASDERIRTLVDNNTFFITPMANPDGYQYSWDKDRYWRKNRRGGYGVDLNRNYSVAFGGPGSSRNRRSQIYRGEGPLSEPEARAMQSLFEHEQIRAHLDLHSFGQLVLHPWSHKKGKAPRHDELAALADNMVTAMFAEHGTRYRLLPAERLYAASGTLMDWVYGTYGALSYVVELRPKRGRGFVLPPGQIVPTCEETFAAVMQVAQW